MNTSTTAPSMTDETQAVWEPVIHSHITDGLPPGHRLAYEYSAHYCTRCETMLHSEPPNECMQTWVETGKGSYCLPCFVIAAGRVLESDWGIPNDKEGTTTPQPCSCKGGGHSCGVGVLGRRVL